MKGKFRSFFLFPYEGFFRLYFLQYVFLKFFPAISFPKMSLVPLTMQYFGLNSKAEFEKRYEASRTAFTDLWSSKSRDSAESVAAFYNEHDADLWRQAALSERSYIYKKKVLLGYHLAKKISAKNILDYGCGASVAGNYLAQKGFTVSGADIPSPTLEFVRKMLPFKSVFTITEDLVLRDSYDYIMCLDALEHTLTPLAITKKLMAALRPEGYFYVNFPIEKDFDIRSSHPHTREAQIERPATFDYLRTVCDELVPELIYRKC